MIHGSHQTGTKASVKATYESTGLVFGVSKNHSIRGCGVKSFVQPLFGSLGEHEGKQPVRKEFI